MKKFCVILGMIFLMGTAGASGAADAAEPLETLKLPVEQIMNLLDDPQYEKGDPENRQRKEISRITRSIFDYTEMSKRALARHWPRFKPEERKEFRDVFADLLENTYYDKIHTAYNKERVEFLKQEMISETKARVETRIFRDDLDIPVNYSMKLDEGIWRVYDVNIEGVSLIKNYRSQFSKILTKKSPVYLIQQLKEKVIELEKEEPVVKQ